MAGGYAEQGYADSGWADNGWADQADDVGGGDVTPPTLSSATIGTSGTGITLVYSESVTGQTAFTLTATSGAVTMTGSSGDGSETHVFTLSRTVGSHETVTLDYDSVSGTTADASANDLASFTGFAVTNNSTQDTIAPIVLTARINVAGTTFTITYSEAVTGQTSFTLSASGGAVTLSSPTGDGTTVHSWTLSRTVASTETVTMSYDSGPGTSADAAGNDLATITNRTVTLLGASKSVAGMLVAIGVL